MQQANKQSLENISFNEMIALLKQYETICISKNDFVSADEAKNKIEFLKKQQFVLKKQKFENEDKENIENLCKQGDEQIKLFQEYWDGHLQEMIQKLKLIENNFQQEQSKELADFQEQLKKQNLPKIKYSSEVLALRKNLNNLIRIKDYKEAQNVKNKLQIKEKQQQQKWIEKNESKKISRIQALKKKQLNELNALRVRAQATFNQSIKQRDQKFEILLKRNRKRKIQFGKIPRERLKTRTALLNESKSYSTVNKN